MEYMPFKGRGRYSNVATCVFCVTDKTVNGEFEIDPNKNDGLNFRFDAVVRDKTERKTLEAGDCEFCRDYYEAVGPLPPRLQAPLWKSPSTSYQKLARTCNCRNNYEEPSPSFRIHTKAVNAHKHKISRHRHNWTPPKTPPDFWKIGFPDTQTVEDINRRANEIHARKFERVEAEAEYVFLFLRLHTRLISISSNNGRFRRRK
ncbi:hypothetical protein K439DRAFT_1331063 [Ramaria rubella]|nr:hypothetical protein K439DRAFT_1331063 [Ramaria rubella]